MRAAAKASRAKARKSEPKQSAAQSVFLGGTCGKSTWRRKFIRRLQRSKIPFFNPQLPPDVRWTREHAKVEKRQLQSCSIVVVVVTGETTGIVSLLEISELISEFQHVEAYRSRRLIVGLEAAITADDLRKQASIQDDRRRAIGFLQERATAANVEIHQSVDAVYDALLAALKRPSRARRTKRSKG